MDVPVDWAQCGQRTMAAARGDKMTARDEEFAALVERQARRMFRVAYSLLRNVPDAEDAVQEAFLKLYRGEAWRRMEDERAFLARTGLGGGLGWVGGRSGKGDGPGMENGARGKAPGGWVGNGDERELLRRMIDG